MDPGQQAGLGRDVPCIQRRSCSIRSPPNPLWLANHLATVDCTSGGRLIVGAGVGWSQRKYEALGYSFTDRGRRIDEILDLLRAAWAEDPTPPSAAM